MDFVLVLAEESPRSSLADRLFERYPALVAVPVFIITLIVAAIVVERVLVFVLKRVTTRTKTTVDDAFVAGLPSILRPLFVLAALHIAANALLRFETATGEAELSQLGKWVTRCLAVVTVLVLGFCVTRLFLRMIDAWVSNQGSRGPVAAPLKFGVKVGMLLVTMLLAIEIGGLEITALLAAASVPALAVGLALQDTLRNMFAGVQIVLDQPIRIGDFVEVDRNARGTVLEIGLRSTKLRSPENNTIIIPNAIIASAIVTNLDYADRSFIQSFEIAVAHGSDTRRVQQILEEVAETASKELEGVLREPNPAALRSLGESSVNFVVNVRFSQWAGRAPLMTELYHRFYDRLRAEGIDIPFPTRTVYLRNETPAPPSAEAAPSQ